MFKIILGAVTGALSGATGGKVDIGKAVGAAVERVAQRPDNRLARQDVPVIAEAVIASLPKPQAAESLWPQIARQGLVFLGGLFVAKGWVAAEDWAVLSGAVLAAVPVIWRIGSTWLARRAAL